MLKLFNQRLLYKLNCSYLYQLQKTAASNYKRSTTNTLASEQFNAIQKEVINYKHLNQNEWIKTRHELVEKYKHINANNVDAIIMGLCSSDLKLAKSYLHFLEREGMNLNAATIGKLLKTFNLEYHSKGQLEVEQQNEVLELCLKLQGNHKVLDAASCEYLIQGLVCTNEWHRAVDYLEMMRLSAVPTVSAYTELIVKAFKTKHHDLAWDLLKDMVQNRKQPKCETFIAYLYSIQQEFRYEKSMRIEKIEQLLLFLNQHNILITAKVISTFEDICQDLTVNLKRSQMNRLGKCSNCSNYLDPVSVKDEDFQALRDVFLQKTLVRNDVYQKSSPQELKRFQEFVQKSVPYDCVIDGLNVAYSTGKKLPNQLSKMVSSYLYCFMNMNN